MVDLGIMDKFFRKYSSNLVEDVIKTTSQERLKIDFFLAPLGLTLAFLVAGTTIFLLEIWHNRRLSRKKKIIDVRNLVEHLHPPHII